MSRDEGTGQRRRRFLLRHGLQEEGIKEFLSGSFIGVSAPAGTPPEIVERLQNETMALANIPAVRQKLIDMDALFTRGQ